MFNDINMIVDGRPWVWQQDGAKAHTAKLSVQWIRDNTPNFINLNEWPSKSPDLNVMDYSLWSIHLAGLAAKWWDVNNMDKLKATLIETWNTVSMNIIQKATASWIPQNRGGHFEHVL